MNPSLNETLQQLGETLGASDRVRAVWLFGSVARGESGPHSDLDIAVWTDGPTTLEERAALQSRATREFDGRDVDLVVVNDASPVLRYRVATDGCRLYVDDPEQVDRFEHRSVMRYLDTAHLRRTVQRLQRRAANSSR